ncbi:MAG: YdcF family protein [Leadbetterella sp.]
MKRRILFTQAGLILILCSGAVVEWIALAWEYPTYPLANIPKKTTAVVLTGGLIHKHANRTLGVSLGPSSDRIYQAGRLYLAHKVEKIVISGANFKSKPGVIQIENVNSRRFLTEMGIPDSCILSDDVSRNTEQNARFSDSVYTKNKLSKDVVLVTSAFHMKRAKACFEKKGFVVTPYSSDPIATHGKIILSDFIPSEEEFRKMKLLLKEILGYMIYTLSGYI